MHMKKYELQNSRNTILASMLTCVLVIYGVIIGMSNNMSIIHLGIMYVLLLVIMLLIMFDKPVNHTYKMMKISASVILVIITAVYAVFVVPTFVTALSHGMYKIDTSLSDMSYNNAHTPPESKLPDDYKHKLIIYYRYDCHDCHAVFEDLKKETADYDVYWVSTRSEQGKKLMEEFPPQEVPTGVVITESDSGKTEHLMRPLGKLENDMTVLDFRNLQELLSFNPDKK